MCQESIGRIVDSSPCLLSFTLGFGWRTTYYYDEILVKKGVIQHFIIILHETKGFGLLLLTPRKIVSSPIVKTTYLFLEKTHVFLRRQLSHVSYKEKSTPSFVVETESHLGPSRLGLVEGREFAHVPRLTSHSHYSLLRSWVGQFREQT